MVNDNIYRKNRLILPRAVIPVRGVDQEEHEFLFFADQSGMQHNERINKFLNQQQHNIHWNGFKDFHWHQQHQEGLEPNDQYCDVNIHRSGLHLQSLSEKETWEDRQKYSEILIYTNLVWFPNPLADDLDPSCKWSSGGAGLLQMVIWRDQPLANNHSEGPASCKW